MEKHSHCLGNLWKGEWWIAKGTWHRGASQTSCHWVWVSFSWECLTGWAISGTGNHLGSLQMPLHNWRVTWMLLRLGTASFFGGNTPRYSDTTWLGVQPWGKMVSSNSGWVFDTFFRTVQGPMARAGWSGPADPCCISEGIIQCSSLELLKSKQGSRGVLESELLPALLSWYHQTVLRSWQGSTQIQGQNLFCSMVAKSQVGGIHFHQPHLAQCLTRENSIVNKDEITIGRDEETEKKERKILNLHIVSREKKKADSEVNRRAGSQ